MTGWTVVTRETEWDDRQRDRLLALGLYESGVCECGFHRKVASDTDNLFTFQTETCPVCRGVARMSRMQEREDEEEAKRLGEKPAPSTPRLADGRRTFVRQLPPAEAAEMRAQKSRSAR